MPTGIVNLPVGGALFVGPNIIHEVAGSEAGSEILSAVFHPRLIAGMDSLIWQKYVQPLAEAPCSVLLERREPWQEACIGYFMDCWRAMEQEPGGYELTARESLSRFLYLRDAGFRLFCEALPGGLWLHTGGIPQEKKQIGWKVIKNW